MGLELQQLGMLQSAMLLGYLVAQARLPLASHSVAAQAVTEMRCGNGHSGQHALLCMIADDTNTPRGLQWCRVARPDRVVEAFCSTEQNPFVDTCRLPGGCPWRRARHPDGPRCVVAHQCSDPAGGAAARSVRIRHAAGRQSGVRRVSGGGSAFRVGSLRQVTVEHHWKRACFLTANH